MNIIKLRKAVQLMITWKAYFDDGKDDGSMDEKIDNAIGDLIPKVKIKIPELAVFVYRMEKHEPEKLVGDLGFIKASTYKKICEICGKELEVEPVKNGFIYQDWFIGKYLISNDVDFDPLSILQVTS